MTAAEIAAIRSRRWAAPLRCISVPDRPEPFLIIGGELFINASAPSAHSKVCARFLRLAGDADNRSGSIIPYPIKQPSRRF